MGKQRKKLKWRKEGEATDQQIQAVKEASDKDLRTGGALKNKSDDSLFFVDDTPHSNRSAQPQRRSKAEKRANPRMLHSQMVLASNPNIKAVHEGTKPKRKKDVTEKHIVSKMAEKFEKQRQQQEQAVTRPAKAPTLVTKLKKQVQQKAEVSADLWGQADEQTDAPPELDSLAEWVEPAISEDLNPRAKKRRALRKPEHAEGVAAVTLIPSGGSYNPSYEAHQQLLRETVDDELKRINAAEKLKQKFNPKVTAKDLQEDTDKDALPAEAADEESGPGPSPAHKAKDKLTRAQRNKQARAKENLRLQQTQASIRKRERQLGRLGAITKELEQKEAATGEMTKKRTEYQQKKVKRLSKHKYTGLQKEVLLTEELPDSLRKLPPQGSLMKDQFNSFQARNLIETRRPVAKRRRYPEKWVTKKQFKEKVESIYDKKKPAAK